MAELTLNVEWKEIEKEKVYTLFKKGEIIALCIQDVPVAYITTLIKLIHIPNTYKWKCEYIGYMVHFERVIKGKGGKSYKKLETAKRNCLKEFNLYEDRIGNIHVAKY